MTKTLVEPILFSREFGSQALRADTLKAWAAKRKLTIPPTVPNVADFDLVALESLLVAIERGVPTMQDDAVLDIASAIPCDPKMRKLIEKGVVQSARWLVGAHIHLQWRGVLAAAIANGELGTVDALTGLPMATPLELANGTQKPVQRQRSQQDAIVAKLVELGYTPTGLPKPPSGTASRPKQEVKAALGYSDDVMKKAWQLLRNDGLIKDA